MDHKNSMPMVWNRTKYDDIIAKLDKARNDVLKVVKLFIKAKEKGAQTKVDKLYSKLVKLTNQIDKLEKEFDDVA